MATLDDVLHVISTDDEKAKIVAMELANDNGRRIIDAFFIAPQSAGDLAKMLDLPMPTVMFHIERLKGTQLVLWGYPLVCLPPVGVFVY